MKTAKIAVAALMVSSLVALSGCGKLIDKLKGVSEDAGEADAGMAEVVDAESGEVVDAASGEVADVDAGADAAAAPTTVVSPGDRLPTYNADEAAAQKDIGAGNYKTQLQSLDKQVKALK